MTPQSTPPVTTISAVSPTIECTVGGAKNQPEVENTRLPLGDLPQAQALYMHLPFCFHKCHYCDFYSVVEASGGAEAGDRQEAFTDALIAEMQEVAGRVLLRPTTVFAGGGTPTYLRPELWGRLLDAMHRLGVLEAATEFTVEANPETLTPELMHQLAAGGVNRVSIGAQSFDRASLKALERWHDPENVGRAVALSRAAGIDNISLDLIFAIPGQTLAMLDRDLDRLLDLQPDHLSTYGLTYEPRTALSARLRVGKVTPVDEDTERAMYERIIDRLEDAGYAHYEISNWARGAERGTGSGGRGTVRQDTSGVRASTRMESGSGERGGQNGEWGAGNAEIGKSGNPEAGTTPPLASDRSAFPAPRFPLRVPHSDLRCQHNLAYWHNRNWLGVGPSAASHMDGHRWRNTPSLASYLQHAPTPLIEDVEFLPGERRVGETIMLRLRLAEGIEWEWLEAHLAPPPDDPRWTAIAEMIDIDMLDRADGYLRLTRRGRFVADSVIAKLL